ncbi:MULTISPECIES: hypothetical protein [Amphritea]
MNSRRNNDKQQEFIESILSKYVADGVH